MRVTGEVLISFFESKREADEGLALIAPAADSRGPRTPAVVVSRELDSSLSPFDTPAVPPLGAAIGAGLGGLLGSVAGAGGVVVGLFFGLYIGLFVDLWRTLARGDLLDEIQDGLAPGQAALVTFARASSATPIDRRLAATNAITVRRFPRTPIEDDLEREVGEVTVELARLIATDDAGAGYSAGRERRIAAARRKLTFLESMATRLRSLERLQFSFEMSIVSREVSESPRWRSGPVRDQARRVRASHRRARMMLEASSARLRAAEVEAEATSKQASHGRAAAR